MTIHEDHVYPFSLTQEELAVGDPATQMRVMRRWFFQHYEDPAVECPHDSGEGGFQFIYGGPYDAWDELHDEFGGVVPDEVIEKLAKKLGDQCPEWSGIPKAEDFDVDEYFLNALVSRADPYGDLQVSLGQLEQMLTTALSSELAGTLMKMTFVSAITAMEAYLSEVFIKEISSSQAKLRSFVETDPAFKQKQIPLSSLFDESEKILETAQSYLAGLMWHNLGKIKPMFKSSLDVEFPDVLGVLMPAIDKRHDIVHRGGKTKDGKTIDVQAADVVQVIAVVKQLAESIKNSLVEPF